MSLTNASILTGATLSATGGTAVNYTPDGKEVVNGIHLIDASVSDFTIRPQLTAKSKDPVYTVAKGLIPAGYGKDKRSVVLVEPFKAANGTFHFNLIRIEREVHPELSAASALDLLKKGAQLAFDADLTAFWATGSLA